MGLSGSVQGFLRSGVTTDLIVVSDTSQLTVTGGSVDTILATFSEGPVNISGGTFGELDALGGTLTVSGGEVLGEFEVNLETNAEVTGGTFQGRTLVTGDAELHIAGGSFSDERFIVGGLSRVTVSGGTFGMDTDISSQAATTIYGGTFGPDFDVAADRTLNLIGTRFLFDGLDMTAAIAQAGVMVLDTANPPLLLEVEFANGQSTTFQFVPEAPLQGPELSTLAATATVNLLVGAGPIEGDYNSNGQVEQGDLDLVLQNWGVDVTVTNIPVGWVNDLPDGQIDQAELDGVLQNWGATNVPNFGGASVPEPVSFGMIQFALAGLLRCRRG